MRRRPAGGADQPPARASSASMANTLAPHRPLGRHQHRARLLLLHPHRRRTSCSAMAESLPIHVISGPDLMAALDASRCHPELAARRRLPAQLALPRQLARRRPLHPRPGHRRRRRASLHRVRQGASGRLRQRAADDVHRRRPRRLRGGRADLPDACASSADYSDIDDVIRMCRLRIRVPDQWWGDYLALVGAARIGERELLELGAGGRLGRARALRRASGSTTASSACVEAIARAARRARSIAETRHDPFPGVPDGVPLRVGVAVDPDGRRRSRSTCATTPTACRAAST